MGMPEPSFQFFRSLPKSTDARKALASSMQTLESVLLLIALKRYPHALIACDAAIESAIKSSSVRNTLPQMAHFKDLINAVRRTSKELAEFPEEALLDFRRKRNRMTHEGFSPRDDSESVGLLLEVGLPFLHQCYQHLFSFDLWGSLAQEVEEQLKIGREVYSRGKNVAGLDRSYCLKSLGHLIQWSLKDNFSADWEIRQLVEAERLGAALEFKLKQREELERIFNPEWVFSCPLCGGPDAVVCQLDQDQLESGNIVPEQLACTNCALVVKATELYLSEALLKGEVATTKEAILRDYGI